MSNVNNNVTATTTPTDEILDGARRIWIENTGSVNLEVNVPKAHGNNTDFETIRPGQVAKFQAAETGGGGPAQLVTGFTHRTPSSSTTFNQGVEAA